MPRDTMVIGVDLPPRLEELSAEVARLIVSEGATGMRRAALLHEFCSSVHVQVVEMVLLAGPERAARRTAGKPQRKGSRKPKEPRQPRRCRVCEGVILPTDPAPTMLNGKPVCSLVCLRRGEAMVVQRRW